jgi:hypothetical protein
VQICNMQIILETVAEREHAGYPRSQLLVALLSLTATSSLGTECVKRE